MKPASRKVRIAVHGARGRMGKRILALLPCFPDLDLAAALDRGNASLPEGVDVVVDFSTAEATAARLPEWSRRRVALVVGTTGLSPSCRARLKAMSRRAGVLVAANMSPGANALMALAAQASRLLPAWEAGITEVHHRAKRDAPSGTAIEMAAAWGRPLEIRSLRLGDVAGEHLLVLSGPGERLELRHSAQGRDAFAHGALLAARFVARLRPGLYGMADALAR